MYSKTYILYLLFTCLSNNNNIRYPGFCCISNNCPGSYSKTDFNPNRRIGEIPLPRGYSRIKGEQASFAGWLRNVPLKKNKTVYTYEGTPKVNQTAQFAVLDITVGNKNLQQCADAVMRIRAEYLFTREKYREIYFKDNEGKIYRFNKPYTHKNLQSYLQIVYAMCGSASLSKQLYPVAFKSIEPGDVIIRDGFPGHVVIVMDVAENKEGNKLYLLAQSYMPAQDIHLLVNPMNRVLSPWYEVDKDQLVQTPEYIFTKRELKRW